MRGGVVDRLLNERVGDAEVVRALYLRTLSRLPTEKESAYCIEVLAKATEKREAVEDLLWALLNSREFVYNH